MSTHFISLLFALHLTQISTTNAHTDDTCIFYDNSTTKSSPKLSSPPILPTIASYPRTICDITNPFCTLSPYEQLEQCDKYYNGGSTTCHIHCVYNGETSQQTNCYKYSWYIMETQYITDIVVNCESQRSCNGLEINVFDSEYDIQINSISILCKYCQSMDINIDRYINNQLSTFRQARIFNIYCLTDNSCKWLNINQYFLPNSSWNDSTIDDYTEFNLYCMVTASCRYADISYFNHAELNLYMFGSTVLFSNGITIMIRDYESVNIQCGNERDMRYFKYKKEHLRDMYDLWEDTLVEYELPVDYTLPCDDITIYSFERNCRLEYRLSDFYNFVDIIKSGVECVWVDTDKLYQAICIDIEDNRYHHTITMEYTLSMNFNSSHECNKYFGTETAENTGENIDGIFFASLFQWLQNNENNGIITNINKVPIEDSVSIDYNCNNYLLDKYYKINAGFYIEATTSNISKVTPLLSEYSEFYNISRKLFNIYFNGMINLGVEEDLVAMETDEWYENTLIWYISGGIFGCCVFIVVVFICCRQQIKGLKRSMDRFDTIDYSDHGYMNDYAYDDETDEEAALTH